MEPTNNRWEARPISSFMIRAGVFLVPIIAALASSLVLRWVLPKPEGLFQTIVWVIAIALPATLVLKSVEQLGRKLLPLAALLSMSMLFPDQAPSRLAVARKGGRVRDLKMALVEMKEISSQGGDSKAAETILSLVAALASHDKITRGHSERVKVFVDLIATEMKLTDSQRDHLRWAALLHDIGKLMVPADILNKTTQLDDQEIEIVQQHPIHGMTLIAPIAEWLGPWANAVAEHHERFDGLGYPLMVKGRDICLGAKIVAVADTFDCMTSLRSYKKPVSTATARQELARVSGSQFDPKVVRAFLNISIGRLWRRVGVLSWIAAVPWFPRPVLAGMQQFGIGLIGALTTIAAIGVVLAGGILDSPMATQPDQDPGLRLVTTPMTASAVDVTQSPGPVAGAEPSATEPSAAEASGDEPSEGVQSTSHGDCVAGAASSDKSKENGSGVSDFAKPEGSC